jgi:hypothetical protein
MGNGKRKPERILREMLPGMANVCRLMSHRVKDYTLNFHRLMIIKNSQIAHVHVHACTHTHRHTCSSM